MRLAAVCQSGLGTSFMVQMNIQNVLNDEGVDTGNFELSHMDVIKTKLIINKNRSR